MEVTKTVLSKAITASFTQNQIKVNDWGKIVIREKLPDLIQSIEENIQYFKNE